MVENFSPAGEQKEENSSPFQVSWIQKRDISNYLASGTRLTSRGITLYVKPTGGSSVGFLIRRRAGHAHERNRTRRIFRGAINNRLLVLPKNGGFLFLFHQCFRSSQAMLGVLNALLNQYTKNQ